MHTLQHLRSQTSERGDEPPARHPVADLIERGGHKLTSHMAGDVQVNISVGHLDRMPRCAKCGKAICQHTDAQFSGAQP